jgi:Ca2+-binding RTX toxin-like protein
MLTGGNAINGTGNALDNIIKGNSAANVLNGGAGNDTLIGLGGADSMFGGTGDDTYVVTDAACVITENAKEGTDTVKTRVSYSLSANVENLILLGSAVINGTGNELKNQLTGNSAANTLDGGLGADTMKGGLGDDTYVVNDVGDVVIESAGQGLDTVKSSVTYALSVNVENLVLTGVAPINGTGNTLGNVLTGNAAANVLTGGAGNDTLIGGGGADTLIGGDGNDVYVVDASTVIIKESASAGVDEVVASVSYTLASNVENLTLVGSSVINATGNTLNNVLLGNGEANTLFGGAGNDTLNGRGGADVLLGGAGNDVYVVDDLLTKITENVNEGLDTVNASVSYTLGANLENLTLTGADAINATGNELNNILAGNSTDNVLSGGAGLDTLTGGAGADKFVMNALLNAKVNMDTITDFSKAQGDQIVLDKSIFTMLAGKTDLTNHFRLSKQAAVGGDDYIVYNATTGQLSYDASGSSSSTAVVFATLSNKPQDLTAQQFVVI